MLIKLTYYGKGTPTLVNLQNVKNIFPIVDKRTNEMVTKIEYVDGTYINVVEDVKKIFEQQWLMMNGSCNMEWVTPTIDEMINSSYQRPQREFNRQPRKNNFNRDFQNNY